jgi:hypothetical protein
MGEGGPTRTSRSNTAAVRTSVLHFGAKPHHHEHCLSRLPKVGNGRMAEGLRGYITRAGASKQE